jgi:hypothetical protein
LDHSQTSQSIGQHPPFVDVRPCDPVFNPIKNCTVSLGDPLRLSGDVLFRDGKLAEIVPFL